MRKPSVTGVEQPRSEPEIIPPRSAPTFERHQRIYVAKVGPFGLLLSLLVVALFAVVALVLLFSLFLISIPVAVVLVAAAIITGWWQGWLRRSP